MQLKMPKTPFSTRLSGSAKETELRLRSIFQWKKKRPPIIAFVAAILVIALCGSLIGFYSAASEEPPAENNSSHQIAPLEGDTLSPNGKYEVHLSGSTEGLLISSGGLTSPGSVQIIDVQTGEVLWECDGLYKHAALWSPDSSYLALACTARTYCTVTIIETNTWTAWNVTLPDGSAIPEYTFLPDGVWGQWLLENNFLLTVGQGSEGGQNVYRCVPIPQESGLTGITEPLTAEDPVNNPTVVLETMASVTAESFLYPEYFGNVTSELLAAALNAAVENQISEEEFMDALGGAYAGVFPHWYIDSVWLERSSDIYSSLDRHLQIYCGLPENIVEVTLSEDNHRDTAYFRDETLYQLVRHGNDYEEIVDPVAYERFKNLLVPEMESVLAQMENNPGNFTGYELKRFILAWSYEDERDGSQVELYHFGFGLLTDTPETVGWAGGMALDSELRVVGVNSAGQLAVKYQNEEVICAAFMGSEFYFDHVDLDLADWVKDRINSTLDRAAAASGYVERSGRAMALLENTALKNSYSYTYSDPEDPSTYRWFQLGSLELKKGDVLLLLEESGGMSRVVIPYGDVPWLYGFVDSNLLSDDKPNVYAAVGHVNQAIIAYEIASYSAPGRIGNSDTLYPCRVEILEMQNGWAQVQPYGTGKSPCWVDSSHLYYGFGETVIDAPDGLDFTQFPN